MLNICLAIVVDSYAEVKAEMHEFETARIQLWRHRHGLKDVLCDLLSLRLHFLVCLDKIAPKQWNWDEATHLCSAGGSTIPWGISTTRWLWLQLVCEADTPHLRACRDSLVNKRGEVSVSALVARGVDTMDACDLMARATAMFERAAKEAKEALGEEGHEKRMSISPGGDTFGAIAGPSVVAQRHGRRFSGWRRPSVEVQPATAVGTERRRWNMAGRAVGLSDQASKQFALAGAQRAAARGAAVEAEGRAALAAKIASVEKTLGERMSVEMARVESKIDRLTGLLEKQLQQGSAAGAPPGSPTATAKANHAPLVLPPVLKPVGATGELVSNI